MEEFKKKIIERGKRCIITGSSYPLVVVYITPIINEADRYDIDNALLMDPTMGALFKNKDITINTKNNKIEVNEKDNITTPIERKIRNSRVFLGHSLEIYSNFEINDKMKNNLHQHNYAFKQKQNMDRIKELKTNIEMIEGSIKYNKIEICNLEKKNKEYEEECLNLKHIYESEYDIYFDSDSDSCYDIKINGSQVKLT